MFKSKLLMLLISFFFSSHVFANWYSKIYDYEPFDEDPLYSTLVYQDALWSIHFSCSGSLNQFTFSWPAWENVVPTTMGIYLKSGNQTIKGFGSYYTDDNGYEIVSSADGKFMFDMLTFILNSPERLEIGLLEDRVNNTINWNVVSLMGAKANLTKFMRACDR